MKKSKMSKWLLVFLLSLMAVIGSVGVGFSEKKEPHFVLEFRVFDPDGKLIDPSLLKYNLRSNLSGIDHTGAGWEVDQLIWILDSEEAVKVAYLEEDTLMYSLHADMGEYMFQLNGILDYESLLAAKNKGEAFYRVDLHLKDSNKVEISSRVEDKYIEGSTVMLSPVGWPLYFWFGDNQSVIGKMNDEKESKTVYLSNGDYVPVFTSEDENGFVYYFGETINANEFNTKSYIFNQKLSTLEKRSIRVEGKLRKLPFYSLFFRAEGGYTHTDVWKRNEITVYYDKRKIRSLTILFPGEQEQYNNNVYSFWFNQDVVLSDRYYAEYTHSYPSNENETVHLITYRDINGNRFNRFDDIDYGRLYFPPFELVCHGEAKGKIEMLEKGDGIRLKYSNDLDRSKTYWVSLTNERDKRVYGSSLYKLTFENNIPNLKFAKVIKYPERDYLSLKESDQNELIFDLEFNNDWDDPTYCELVLIEGDQIVQLIEGFYIEANEYRKDTFTIQRSMISGNSNQRLAFYSDGSELDSFDLIEYYATDIKGHWALESILALLDKGIFSTGRGMESQQNGGAFYPNKAITRGEFESALYRYAKLERKVDLKREFPQNPDKPITRQEAAIMIKSVLYKTLKNPVETKGSLDLKKLSLFQDASKISNSAKGSMTFCVENQILTGDKNKNIKPLSTLTRAEAAAIIYKLCNMNPERLVW